jgi:hypothetical protein
MISESLLKTVLILLTSASGSASFAFANKVLTICFLASFWKLLQERNAIGNAIRSKNFFISFEVKKNKNYRPVVF